MVSGMSNSCLRDTSFTEQIAVMRRVEFVPGRRIVREFMFGEWRGIIVTPLIPTIR
jgi:hypothetical protein